MTASEEQMPQGHSCRCNDPSLDELRRMVAEGVSQRDASLILWGGDTPVSNAVAKAQIGREARQIVQRGLLARIPWLRLPARSP